MHCGAATTARFTREVPTSHANAALTPRHRLRLARLVVDDGWTVTAAARFFRASWPTPDRWASRYAAMGEAGMQDRSSRLHHSPTRTPSPRVKRIIALRWRKRMVRSRSPGD